MFELVKDRTGNPVIVTDNAKLADMIAVESKDRVSIWDVGAPSHDVAKCLAEGMNNMLEGTWGAFKNTREDLPRWSVEKIHD